MTTGYRISGGTDLDALFKARASTAGANVGYKSSGSVDLAQRFEPRGGSTAIANTGYKSGGVDLAQKFMDIAATGAFTMTAATSGGVIGWQSTATGAAAIGSISGDPTVNGFVSACAIYHSTSTTDVEIWEHSTGGSRPTDTDTSWSTVDIVGVFSDSAGATVTRTLTRSARTLYLTGSGTNNSVWTFALSALQLISGNVYGVTFHHT